MSASTLPAGPRGLPIVGTLFEMSKDPLGFFTALHQNYGEAAAVDMLGRHFFFFAHPRAVKNILIDNARNFTNREGNPELRELIGDGLLSLDGAEHRRQRRIVQPAFNRTRIEAYADVMVAQTRRMLDHWSVGAELDISVEMETLTMQIAGATLFGADLGGETSSISRAFLDAAEFVREPILSLSRLPINLPFTAYGKYKQAKQHLDDVVGDLIERRRRSGTGGDDVLSMLLAAHDEDGSMLDDRQIRDHVLTFLAAGHATTANALSWTFYLLSENENARQKVLNELAAVLDGRAPTVADLARLPYLEMVVKESMRIYPPAWIQIRRAIADYDLEGYHFPGGSFAAVSQWVTHHRPDLWRDPEVFRPERFAPDSGEEPAPLAYFPFGGGPRTCIGMPFAMLEARLVLATVLQRFTPTLVPGYPVVPRPLIILQPKNGIRMLLEPAQRPMAVAISV